MAWVIKKIQKAKLEQKLKWPHIWDVRSPSSLVRLSAIQKYINKIFLLINRTPRWKRELLHKTKIGINFVLFYPIKTTPKRKLGLVNHGFVSPIKRVVLVLTKHSFTMLLSLSLAWWWRYRDFPSNIKLPGASKRCPIKVLCC